MQFSFRNKQNEDEKQIRKDHRNAITRIVWPAFIELVMSTLFGMVDMVMVGQISSAAIASVGLTNQPFMFLLAIFAAVNVGTTTLVAWNIGGRHLKEARAVTRQAIVINLALGTVISVLGVLIARPVIIFMGANSDTIGMAVQYYRIIASGLVFQVITLCITASLRGAGETKIPMFYNVSTNLINVFGNYVLINGALGFPKMGVSGAALSTSISRLVACLIGLYTIFFSRKSIIRISFKDSFKLDLKIVKDIFRIGIPSAMEQFVMQSGLILFARTVSGLGTSAFAAHQIGLNISGLSFAPSMAFGAAATTLVGQSLGANNKKLAEDYSSSIHRLALGTGALVALIFIIFSHPMARVYTDDSQVTAMAGTILKILALAIPGLSTQISISGGLRGAGDTMFPLYASAIGIWVFRVFLSFLFIKIFHWGIVGAWIAFVLDQNARAVIVYLRYKSGKWKYLK